MRQLTLFWYSPCHRACLLLVWIDEFEDATNIPNLLVQVKAGKPETAVGHVCRNDTADRWEMEGSGKGETVETVACASGVKERVGGEVGEDENQNPGWQRKESKL